MKSDSYCCFFDYTTLVSFCQGLVNSDEIVSIIVNGRGGTVSAYEEYKRMKAGIEPLEILAKAENDVENGRTAPVCEIFEDLRKILREDLV